MIVSTLISMLKGKYPVILFNDDSRLQSDMAAYGLASTPTICIRIPLDGALTWEAGRIKESANIDIMVLMPANKDFEGEDNQILIDRCIEVAASITNILVFSADILLANTTQSASVPIEYIYERYADRFTGVMLHLSLIELTGYCANDI